MRSGEPLLTDTLLKPTAAPLSRTQKLLPPDNMLRSAHRLAACAGLLANVFSPVAAHTQSGASAARVAMVIHGGAGNILRPKMKPAMEKAYIDSLTIARRTRYHIPARGGERSDAVGTDVRRMGDS